MSGLELLPDLLLLLNELVSVVDRFDVILRSATRCEHVFDLIEVGNADSS